MSQKARLDAESSEGLTAIFEALVDHAKALESEGTVFQATPAKSGTLGSGLPEVTEIILALGSSGAFVALAAVLKSYFDKRPSGKITLSLQSKDRRIEFSA